MAKLLDWVMQVGFLAGLLGAVLRCEPNSHLFSNAHGCFLQLSSANLLAQGSRTAQLRDSDSESFTVIEITHAASCLLLLHLDQGIPHSQLPP